MRRPLPKTSKSRPNTGEPVSRAQSLPENPGDLVKKTRIQSIFLLLFSLALYANTLWFGYTLDDALMITQNQFTKQGVAGIPSIMTHDAFTGFFGVQKQLVAGGRYRPLSQVVFALEHQVAGLNPFLGHLVNVVVYGLLSLLLFSLLRRLMPAFHRQRWYQSVPFLATALFIAHPLHTEVVANIKGLDELLSLGFSLLTLHFALLYIDHKKLPALAGVLVSFLLALISKENAVTFLVIIFLCLYFFRQSEMKSYLLCLLPLLLAFGVYLGLRFQALGYLTSNVEVQEVLNDPYLRATTAQHWATNIFTWGKYLVLLIFPHPLTHDYYPWQISLKTWADAGSLLSLVSYLGLGILAIWGLKKKTLLSFGILLFLIAFSISSNIVFNIGTFMNERFMFVPLLGFAIVLAWLLTGAGKPMQGKALMYVSVVLLCLYSVKTVARNFVWKDDFTLFTTDVLSSSNSTKCNVSAGGVLIEKAKATKEPEAKAGYLQRAENCLNRAVEIYPENSAGWVLLGNVYLERKDYAQARDYYIRCLNVNNIQPEALNKLGFVGYKLSTAADYQGSMTAFMALDHFQPGQKKNKIEIVDALSKTGRTDSALVILNQLLATDSLYPDGLAKLGEIYGRVYNRIDLSEAYLTKAYKLDPKNVSTLENLGIVHGMKKDFGKSLMFLNKALAMDSTNPRILSNIASTYYMMGNKATADVYGKRAAEAKKNE